MIGYVRKFDGNAIMSFTISNKQLLKKYNQIWKKAGKLLKIEFDSKPIYGDDDKYIKTKTKIYDGGMIANLQSEKKPKEKSLHGKCLSIIILDSVIKANKKYYPQTLLKECKYEQETTKMENLIDDDVDKSESNDSDSDSNDETKSDDESNEYLLKSYKSILITIKA